MENKIKCQRSEKEDMWKAGKPRRKKQYQSKTRKKTFLTELNYSLEELYNIKKELTSKTENYENELTKLSKALSNVKKEISTMVQALSGAQDTLRKNT